MLIPEEAPQPWRRILQLAERAPGRAARVARRALAAVSTDDKLALAWAHYTLGWTLLRAEDAVGAKNRLETACRLFEAAFPLGVLHSRRAVLMADIACGASASLQTSFQDLVARYEAQGCWLDAARTRIQQVSHLNMLVRPQEALALAAQLAPLVEAEGTLDDLARLLRVTGIAHAYAGELDQALSKITAAAALFARLEAPIEVAKCRFECAHVHHRREEFAAALAELEQAAPIFARFSLPVQEAFCEKSMGVCASNLGRYNEALALTLRARAHFERLHRRDQVAACDLNLGTIAGDCGLYDFARAVNWRAIEAYREMGIVQRALMAQRNEAIYLRAQGQLNAALQLLVALEEPARQLGDLLEIAQLIYSQAEVLHELGDHQSARERLTEAQDRFAAAGSTGALAESRVEEGWLQMEQGELTAAVETFTTARRELGDRPMYTWRIDYGLGRCAQQQGDILAAQRHYQSACATVAGLRRTLASEHASSAIFSQAEQLYAYALQIAADQNDVRSILLLADQQRALAFHHRLRDDGHTALQLPPDLREPYERLRGQIQAALENPGTALALEETLAAYTALLLLARHTRPLPDEPPEALDLVPLSAELDAAFPDGWLSLIYVTCQHELLLVMLDQQQQSLTRIPLDDRFRRLLAHATRAEYRRYTYRDAPRLRDPASEPWSEVGDLTRRLLPPAALERLHPRLRLLVVPSGALHALPWPALWLGEAWLCERAVIQTLPGLVHWSRLRRREHGGDTALLVGCSRFGGRAADLPYVPFELERVAAHWPGPVRRLEDQAATRRALLDLAAGGTLRELGLLHIATHAQLTVGRGALAHIKLWDDDMFHDELAGLRLNGALVALVACEGQASEVLPGEEVLSLGRAFLAAGARDVIAAIWPVFDAAACGLIDAIYGSLAGGHDAAFALTEAQRACIHASDEALRSPITWGGLQLVGVGERLGR